MALPDGVESLFCTETTLGRVACEDLGEGEGKVLTKYVPKETILDDIQFRGAISDFHPIKKKIEKCDYDPILVRYNHDDKYGDGNNVEVFVTAAAAQVLKDAEEARLKAEEEARLAAEAAEEEKRQRKLNKRAPRVAKEWVSQGSENEISEATIVSMREPVQVTIARKRREFSAPYKFSDKDSQDLWNSSQMECRPFKDPNFELKRLERDVGTQAIASTTECAVQATNNPQRAGASQYQPCLMDPLSAKAAQTAPGIEDFLRKIKDNTELALQQNECFDIFEDDFGMLADDDSAPGHKSENVITEYQSFTDLKYSKGMLVSGIDWLTKQKGVVAVACTEPYSLDERVEVSGKVKTSAVLVWNFKDPIHPQYVLESPLDVTAFKINPQAQNLVAGGLYNGQVILWDITAVEEALKKKDKKGDEESGEKVIPTVQHKFLSVIETSHTQTVTDLEWLSDGYEVNRQSKLTKTAETNQFVTCSLDSKVIFWDVRVKKDLKKAGRSQGADEPFLWAPTFVINLSRLELAGDHLSAVSMSLSKEGSNSKFFIGSMDGEVCYADFDKPEGQEHPEYSKSIAEGHAGPIQLVERSPFFPDILLSVGDWSFKIWKEGVSQPIFSSGSSPTYLCNGCWSPGRPGVIFIARLDGTLEVWDLLDRSHEPSMIYTASSFPISSIKFNPMVGSQRDQLKEQLLAVGDNQGVLHILEMPRNLRRPVGNEVQTMRTFFERELARVEYVEMRTGVRQAELLKEKEALASGGGAEDGAAAASGEEWQVSDVHDEKAEAEYRKVEHEFKVLLGLVEA